MPSHSQIDADYALIVRKPGAWSLVRISASYGASLAEQLRTERGLVVISDGHGMPARRT